MRKLILIFLTLTTLFSDILEEKIKTLVDTKTYLRHQRLIGIVFREREEFINGENIDYIKVVETLKSNGLLEIFYDKPRDLTINFNTTIAPKIFIKSITDILRDLGYNFYVTGSMKKSEFSLKWSINYTSDHVVDPLLFAKKLQKYNMEIHELSKKGDVWEYDIGSIGVSLDDAKKIDEFGVDYSLLDPDGEYWIEFKIEPARAAIKRRASGYWYPKIVFYDKNLRVLKNYQNDNSRRRVKLSIPAETKFLKITDKYSVEGLKKGIIVSVEEAKEEQK